MAAIDFFCVICGSPLTVPAGSWSPVKECPACRHVVPVPASSDLAFEIGNLTAALPAGVLTLEMKFLCETCDSKLRIDVRMGGREIICPECQQPTTVPQLSRRGAPSAGGVTRASEAPAVLLSDSEMDFLSNSLEALASEA
jgi:DNA-directed RNA polymerase subunit RPC12/RpoP